MVWFSRVCRRWVHKILQGYPALNRLWSKPWWVINLCFLKSPVAHFKKWKSKNLKNQKQPQTEKKKMHQTEHSILWRLIECHKKIKCSRYFWKKLNKKAGIICNKSIYIIIKHLVTELIKWFLNWSYFLFCYK